MNFEKIESAINRIVGKKTEMNSSSVEKVILSRKIAGVVNQHITKSECDVNKENLGLLNREGIVSLDQHGLPEQRITSIINYFKKIPVFNGHVPAQGDGCRRFVDLDANKYSFGSYSLEDTMQCPYLLELALDAKILALVEAYLGCVPTVYSMNTWWSFPGFSPRGPQDYHRDVDDFKFLALFVYLTDIKGGNDGGQHQFMVQTHQEDQVVELLHGNVKAASELFTPKLKQNGYHQQGKFEKLFSTQIKEITGCAGSVFLADTYGLHRGVPPQKNSRLVCWIRYGLRKNLAYTQDETRPIPVGLIKNRIQYDKKMQYMLRLLATEDVVSPPTYKVVVETNLAQFNWNNLDNELRSKSVIQQAITLGRKRLENITFNFPELGVIDFYTADLNLMDGEYQITIKESNHKNKTLATKLYSLKTDLSSKIAAIKLLTNDLEYLKQRLKHHEQELQAKTERILELEGNIRTRDKLTDKLGQAIKILDLELKAKEKRILQLQDDIKVRDKLMGELNQTINTLDLELKAKEKRIFQLQDDLKSRDEVSKTRLA